MRKQKTYIAVINKNLDKQIIRMIKGSTLNPDAQLPFNLHHFEKQ